MGNTAVIDEDMLKECNDIISKLEKSPLSTKIRMVQDILARNVQLMKDIEKYQTKLDEATTTVQIQSGDTGENDNGGMEVDNGASGRDEDDLVVSGYVDSV